MSRTTRARPAAKRQADPAAAGHGGYLASDLALFDALTPSADRLQPRPAPAAEARSASSRPIDSARPERGRNVRPPEHRYEAADDALFATLQAGFAQVRDGERGGGQTGVQQGGGDHADAGSVADPHGYSQDDLDAFERLTRFGPFR